MKNIRKGLTLLLALLVAAGAATPAYAVEDLFALSGGGMMLGPVVVDGLDEQSTGEEPEDAEPEDAEPEDAEPEDEEPENEASEPAESAFVWQQPGARDVEILAGGRMLTDGADFYYVSDGIWCETDGTQRCIVDSDGANLNRDGDWLYYTTADGVRRYSLSDGTNEFVYECADIEQLYVMGSWLLYLADGCVYAYDMNSGARETMQAPAETTGLIPTEYGNLYLTGGAGERCVWVEGSAALEPVESCYTDSGYLVVYDGQTRQIELAALFAGERTLKPYSLHADRLDVQEMTEEEAAAAEAAYFESEQYAAIEALSAQDDGVMMLSMDNAVGSSVYITGQQLALANEDMDSYNIARRGRQQAEVIWTALKDVYGWGGASATRTVTSKSGLETNYFVGGEVYQGIPYSWPIKNWTHNEVTYVGWQVSVSDFVGYTSDSASKFYTDYSYVSEQAPYYGSDCAAFVSSAWDLYMRCTCSSLVYFSDYIGNQLNQIRLGDCLNKTTDHVVLVTDVGYDYYGNIVAIEITEQTPLRMKVTNYGQRLPGKANEEIFYNSDITAVQRYYLNDGYDIYRRSVSTSVSYTSDPAVPLEEDGWLAAPTMQMVHNEAGDAVVVTLSHMDDAPIHYTTDGSEATLDSPLYTGPIEIREETVIRAVADWSGLDATGSFELIYTVEAKKAAAPTLVCLSGAMNATEIQRGSYITLTSDEGARIYYTTDGSEPTLESAQMPETGIRIAAATTLRAFAVAADRLRSPEMRFDLTLASFYDVKTSSTGVGTVTPEGTTQVIRGGSQTFTFQAGANYRLGDVKIDGKRVGAVGSYTLSNVEEDHTIEVTFVIELPFADVSATAWYADEIAYAYTHNLVKGVEETLFMPDSYMTRGQFATVLGRYAGQDELENFTTGRIGYTADYGVNIRKYPTTGYDSSTGEYSKVVGNISNLYSFVTVYSSTSNSAGEQWYKIRYGSTDGYIKAYYNGSPLLSVYSGKFTDIAGFYYNGYIQWAHYNGIIDGRSETIFEPQGYISRQDMCKILYNYLTKCCGQTLNTGNKVFADESQIEDYAKTAVHALAAAGIVQGDGDGKFYPRRYATRAEVATVFMNLDHYLSEINN